MQFIEYSTGGGTKRGYIRTSDGTPQNNTILAKSKGDISTYTTPGGGKDGYLYEEEYCVILAQSKKYYNIEYNTVTGRKVAFVPKTDLTVIGSLSNVPSAPNSESNTTMLKNQSVYGGPSDRIYASIGSVDANEEVTIIHVDGNYCYIQYYTSTTYKRGYVPISSVADVPNDKLEHPITYTNGYYMKSFAATSVYSAPDSTSAALGSVYALEGVTYFGVTEGIFAFVEYSSVTGPKRGFIYAAHLFKTYEKSGFAKCNADTNVYYTPEGAKIGTIYTDEYVCVLNWDDQKNLFYIEYNSADGRKRGYASCSTVNKLSGEVEKVDSSYGKELILKSSSESQKVYSGPSSAYYSTGAIFYKEVVRYLGEDSGMTFIQYNYSGGYKRGYVPSNTLITFDGDATITGSDLVMVDIPGTTRKTLCESGNGRTINYYEIGSEHATKQMILNFAIHGHEDAAALLEQDGYELTKLAVKLTRYLGECVENGDNLNGWRIYIIPALNPDGILHKHSDEDNDPVHTPHNDYYDCNGIGRHSMNEIEWSWNGSNELTAAECISKGTRIDGGHTDMNRCFMFKQDGAWTYIKGFSSPGRNYIGNGPLRAKEALYMHEFINTLFALNADDRIFIDTHGWTTQIITSDDGILKAFKDEFDYKEPNQITPLIHGEGYVARYAKDLGYRSCLFEFPEMNNTNVSNPYNFNHIEINGWDDKYIRAIMTLINSSSNTQWTRQAVKKQIIQQGKDTFFIA